MGLHLRFIRVHPHKSAAKTFTSKRLPGKESLTFQQPIPISASTDPSAAHGADIVLLCVKTPDTEAAAKSLAPYLTDRSVVLSLQNGVDNGERIRAAIGIESVPAVVYGRSKWSRPVM
jgi:2-dehydropantoate 2-reductase